MAIELRDAIVAFYTVDAAAHLLRRHHVVIDANVIAIFAEAARRDVGIAVIAPEDVEMRGAVALTRQRFIGEVEIVLIGGVRGVEATFKALQIVARLISL